MAARPPRKPSTPKPFEVTPAVCKKVKRLGGLGLTLPEIGASLGLSTTTLKHWRRASPELERAYQEGRAVGIGAMAGALRRLAEKGNVAAIIFFLKTQCRWSELNGAPAANERETDVGDLPRDELLERIRSAAHEWPEDIFQVVLEKYEELHRCRIRFVDAVEPPALPAPREAAAADGAAPAEPATAPPAPA